MSKYVSTLQPGIEIALDCRERWALSPYAVFPPNHAATEYETKRAAGFLLSFTYCPENVKQL